MLDKFLDEKILKKLIEIPSVSGDEKTIAQFIFDYLKQKGLAPKIKPRNNVYCEAGRGDRVLVLNAHLDTVPPSKSWSINPFRAAINDGKLYGLGAADTKGNLAAMIDTYVQFAIQKPKPNGKLIFLGTSNEEVGHPSGLEEIIPKIDYNAIVIGEPTELDICVAEKGLLIFKVKAKGKAAHAATGSKEFNAIYKAAKDINILSELEFPKKHEYLGYPSVQATLIKGGVVTNMIPDYCEVVVDVRTTPNYPNELFVDLVKKKLSSEIEIVSNRIFPKSVARTEQIVQVAKQATPWSNVTGFTAISDFAFIQKPGIILGAGSLAQAHSPDEFVEISQLDRVRQIYQKIVGNYFSVAKFSQ